MENKSNPQQLVSETIDLIRFPMAVFVVFIHTCSTNINVNDTTYPIYQFLRALFSNIIASVAVPTFFIISGYLFYKHLENWNWDSYYEKLKQRVKTLFVPYLLWNSMYIVFALSGAIYSVLMKRASYTVLSDWFNSEGMCSLYWGNPYPYLVPLWYIRDLMIIVLFAAIIYWFTKKMHFVLLIIAYSLFLKYDVSLASSVFYFSLGALFQIDNGRLRHLDNRNIRYLIIIIYVLLLCMKIIGLYVDLNYSEIFNKLYLIIGPMAVLCVGYELAINGWKISIKLLVNSSFFVYVFHYFLIYYIPLILRYIMGDDSQLILILVYFSSTFTIVCMSVFLYSLLNRYTPFLMKVLMGGR